MSKLLTTTAAALILAASGAYAADRSDDRYGERHNNGHYSASAIQKGQSASTKAYGYHKQGDHYSARDAYREQWNMNTAYPGSRPAYGTRQGVVIKKGGSGIADASTEASTRQYGQYWN